MIGNGIVKSLQNYHPFFSRQITQEPRHDNRTTTSLLVFSPLTVPVSLVLTRYRVWMCDHRELCITSSVRKVTTSNYNNGPGLKHPFCWSIYNLLYFLESVWRWPYVEQSLHNCYVSKTDSMYANIPLTLSLTRPLRIYNNWTCIMYTDLFLTRNISSIYALKLPPRWTSLSSSIAFPWL